MAEKITLKTPVKIDGVPVDSLTIREPLVSDMLASKKGKSDPADIEIALFANLCEVAPETIKQLSMRDYNRLQKAFRKITEDEDPLA